MRHKGMLWNDHGRLVYFLLLPIVFLLISVIVLWIVIMRLRTPAGKGFVDLEPPVNIIWTMYESARRGNTEGYIDCFVPESQGTIRETLKSKGEDAFSIYIKEMSADIMGVSILSQNGKGPGANPGKQGEGRSPFYPEGDIISVQVEIIFKGRNKLQIFNLKRAGNTWKIFNLSSPTLTPQPIPYGRNVNE